MKRKNNILVVCAHPDDEVLGCGGTMARHVANGDSVSAMFMTNGVSARRGLEELREVNLRKHAAKQAASIVATAEPVFLDFPDNAMDTIQFLDIVKSVEEVIDVLNPNIVYTHFPGDLNIDHCLTHKAVLTACRPQRSSPVEKIYCFEVLSSTEWSSSVFSSFNPNIFVNITHFWAAKEKALKCYNNEMRESPHSRSYTCVESLASLRGQTSGFRFAEAFVLERMLIT